MNQGMEAILQQAQSLGFADAFITGIDPIPEHVETARLRGFDPSRICVDPRELLPEARSILLLCRPYQRFSRAPKGYGWVSPYYYQSHQGYLALRALISFIHSLGIQAVSGDRLPIKALSARAGWGPYGANGLIQHPQYGSQIYLGVLVTDGEWAASPSNVPSPSRLSISPNCQTCQRCVQACPVKALDGTSAVNIHKCLRREMLNGTPVEVWKREHMGQRLIGCDICREVCPANQDQPIPQTAEQFAPFQLDSLLRLALEDDQTGALPSMTPIHQLLGKNCGKREAWVAQAALAAGNAGRSEYVPLLERLAQSEQEAIRVHAQWAIERIREKAK